MRKKRFTGILAPGEYWIFTLGQHVELERHNTNPPIFSSGWADCPVKERPEPMSRHVTLV